MPKTADEHDDHQIQRGSKWPDLITAEWNVEVVAQKCGQRYVPAPPEIGKADCGVRETEVVFEMKTECKRGADRADRVAGEIEKDLSRERDYARPRIERDERPAVIEDAVGRSGK